jgi:S-disulfanyl-L-cysteine oxidoreductase SoxD
MFSSKSIIFVAALLATGLTQAQSASYSGIGRQATPKEISAWDIDVRPDLKGLPKGSGTVAKGQDVWEAKCAGCHGVFGESNEVFSPLVGGTTKDDVKTGRVARLTDAGFPGRTTLMKVPTVSTLWDYINRAMPWNQPKSLSVGEVYAVTAFLLNLGGVVPDNFTLSNDNMAEVQKLMPNRNGVQTNHSMWAGKGFGNAKPDVKAVACMKNCAPDAAIASALPDFARNAHGNLAEQNRMVGAQKGANTANNPAQGKATTAAAPAAATGSAAALTALQKHSCTACHGIDTKLVGPSFQEISKKHAARGDAAAYLAGKIKAGGSGVWGAIPMPGQSLPESDSNDIVRWIIEGAKK